MSQSVALRRGTVQRLRPPAALRRVARDPGVRYAALATVALRAGLGLIGAAQYAITQHASSFGGLAVAPWMHDDALWFAAIGRFGYGAQGTGAFPPGYPALVGAVGHVIGSYEVAGLVVATAATFLALFLMHRLATLELGGGAARNAVLAVGAFPTALFLVAGYSESLFLAEVLAVFYLGRTQRLAWAGLAGAAAVLTRQQGLLVGPVLLVLACDSWRGAGGEPLGCLLRRIVAACGPAALALAGLIAGYELAGLGSGPWANEAGWGGHLSLPWVTVADSLHAWLGYGHPEEVMNLLAVALIAATLPFTARRLPRAYLVYAGLALLMILGHEDSYSPLMSSARFVLAIPTVFLAIAALLERRPAAVRPIVATSSLLLAGLFVMFAAGRFVG